MVEPERGGSFGGGDHALIVDSEDGVGDRPHRRDLGSGGCGIVEVDPELALGERSCGIGGNDGIDPEQARRFEEVTGPVAVGRGDQHGASHGTHLGRVGGAR